MSAKKPKRRESAEVKKLKKLHKAGLLSGLTVEALEARLAEVEIAAEREREADPDGDDPRAFSDRWLDHAFYLYLVEAGPAEGVLTSSVSPAGLTLLLSGELPGKLAFAESADARGGRKVRVSFPGSSRAPLEVLWESSGELAAVANFALAEVRDQRRFVKCQIDPRFELTHLETIYLLATPAQLRALVELGIIRDDEQISDVVEPIAGPPELFLRVRGFGWKHVRRLQLSVLAMPRGGKWHIEGSFEAAPRGPIATNLTGQAYDRLYEIRGWKPSSGPTLDSFTAEWEMQPGVLLSILDGGDADEAPDLVRAALDELKQAANSAGTGAPGAPVEPTEVAVVTAQIGGAQLLARWRRSATALVVRSGAVLEPGDAPMALEPGDAVLLSSGLGSVTSEKLVALMEQVDIYGGGPAELLLARAVEAGAVRPALLIAEVALRQKGR